MEKSQSDTIGKLAEALAKAQGEMESAKKDSVNPFFKSKYADIASVIEAIREPASKYGLSYVQSFEGMLLITKLLHSSGEWISSSCPLLVGKDSKNEMQSLGSAITYARRYSLSAMFGIAQEDDDANLSASSSPKIHQKRENAPTPLLPSEKSFVSQNKESDQKSQVSKIADKITLLRRDLEITAEELREMVFKEFKTDKFHELDYSQLQKIIQILENVKAGREKLEEDTQEPPQQWIDEVNELQKI